jgi:hypothetical protein
MIKQQYFLAFLATNLLVTLTNQSAIGFTANSDQGGIISLTGSDYLLIRTQAL